MTYTAQEIATQYTQKLIARYERQQRIANRVVIKKPLLWEQPYNEGLATDKVINDSNLFDDPFDDGVALTLHAVDYDIAIDKYGDVDDELEGLTIVECNSEQELFQFCTGYEEVL